MAYTLWDRSADLWMRVLQQWPELKNTEASPAKTVFTLDNRYTISSELERAAITDFIPTRKADSFAQMADTIIGLHCRVLEVSRLTRLGFRVLYWKEYPTTEDAAEAIHSLRLVNLPRGPHFGIEKNPKEYNYALRFDGETVGVHFRLLNVEMKAELEIPPEVQWSGLENAKAIKIAIQCDIDYYTTQPAEVDQLGIKDWILNAHHIIKRDSDIFLST